MLLFSLTHIDCEKASDFQNVVNTLFNIFAVVLSDWALSLPI